MDIVGGHNGTFVGTTAYTTGSSGVVPDQAFSLNGSSYVDIPDASLYAYSDVISVAAWVKPSGDQSNGSEAQYAGIVTKDDDTWRLAMWSQYRAPSYQPNLVYFGVSGGVSPGYHDAVSTTAIADGNWHFVVGVYDGTYTNIYVDGQFQAQTYSGGALPTETSTDVQIGANGGGRIFSGAIDEAQIYHAALTPADVTALYNAGSGGQCETPSALVTSLISLVDSFNIDPQGLAHSYDAQLQAVLSDLSAGNTAQGCSDLASFISHVNAQSGKELLPSQAAALTAAAQQIQTRLGC